MLSLPNKLRLLHAYWQQKNLRLDNHWQLREHQGNALFKHLTWLSHHSPGLAPVLSKLLQAQVRLAEQPRSEQAFSVLSRLPVIDKASWLERFDMDNTAGLWLDQVRTAALAAEQSRDFDSTLVNQGQRLTVGLSSGTSGSRGVFVVSEQEQARWAGVILAKLLPRGLLAGEKVAFFLRANSNLYTATRSRWLTFEFFDLLKSFEAHLERLLQYRPTIIVAPAQVLQALAPLARKLGLSGCTVVSVAEVLEPQVRDQLKGAFKHVAEVYQATEGLLATTCEHGRLHLNEEHLVIERSWLSGNRYLPIITDFRRTTQPLLRYQLNDVLVDGGVGCPCGRVSHIVAHIEGRQDDMLRLPSFATSPPVTVFADAVSRVIAQHLPVSVEYELVQSGSRELALVAPADVHDLERTKAALEALFKDYGVDVAALNWSLKSEATADATPGAVKRRRIRRQ